MLGQKIEKRVELKHLLSSDGYVTFIDLLFNYSAEVIQKLFRRRQTVAFYWSAAFLCVFLLVVGFLISALFGEFELQRELVKMEVLGVVLAFLSLVIFKIARNAVINNLSKNILDSIVNESSVVDLQKWVDLFTNVKAHLTFCIIYAIGFSSDIVLTLSSFRQEFIGYGSSFIIFSVAFLWGIPMYFLLVFILLPYHLGQYEFRLYKADPSSSIVISDLSRLLSRLVYLYAIVAAGSMIFIAYSGLLSSLALPSIFVAWLPIIVLFIINHYALSNIIVRGKWITLRQIQIQVENIQEQGALSDKDVMERVIRLMDFHDRVKGTKSSALDVRAGLDFINSLFLPIIGFFIGNINIEFIQAIFERAKILLPLR